MIAQTQRRQFTVHDYAHLREAGILTEDDRVELLDGEIYLMSPILLGSAIQSKTMPQIRFTADKLF